MVWAFVIILVLLIPLLAIVLDSQFGQALADRISGRRAETSSLDGRLEALEGEVRYLAESVEQLREESAFLRSLVEGRSEPRSLEGGGEPRSGAAREEDREPSPGGSDGGSEGGHQGKMRPGPS